MIRQPISYNPIDLEPDIAVGIALPFSSKYGGLFTLNYTTELQAISNLKNLLLTRKGERIMLPSFGSSLYDTLFEQITSDLPIKVKEGLKSDISYWCPQIIINNIVVEEAESTSTGMMGHGIQIKINFRVDVSQANRTIILFISNNGNAQIVTDQSKIISVPKID